MTFSEQTAKHLRGIYFGGNWTVANYKEQLADISWQEATHKVHGFNTIATLVYHVNYFTGVLARVLAGGPLDAHDKYSWETPAIHSEQDWQAIVQQGFTDAERCVDLIAQLPEEKYLADFADPKYGNYYANIHGIVEHLHYHLGQVVLLKKLIRQPGPVG